MQSSDGVEPFDWNEQFQRIQAEYYDDYEKELDRLDRLNSFVEKFTAVATEAGRTIISELFLPDESRTIRSVTSKVGGIAGGEKYIYRGIFLKFTKDNQGIFGGNDDSAMKAGAHEWRSYLELADCRIPGLHFPFVIALDYRGYRVLAQTVLPIDSSTLVYGSPDGGRTVISADPEMVQRVKRAAKMLNLCSHTVWNESMTSCVKLYTPIDCEGHLGKDKRFYLLDPARLFPPEPPLVGVKGGRLFRLLRPELLKHIRFPLCSDAFSRFNVENLDAFNADVSSAHAYLFREVIPAFCSWLQERFDSIFESNNVTISVDLILEIETQAHRRGINFRYLGLVLLGLASCPTASCIVWTAIVARVIKGIVRSHFRALKSSAESAFRKLFLTYLNLIFAPLEDKKAQEFWNKHLKDRVEKQFPKACTGIALARDYPTHGRSLLDRVLLFFGCKLTDDAANAKIPGAVCAAIALLEDRDLTELTPVTRSSNRISLQNATAVAKKALSLTSDTSESRRLLREAEQNFKSALQLKPDDIRAIQNWALSLALHAGRLERVGIESESDSLYASAIEKLRSAFEIDNKDTRTHTIWANLLYEMASSPLRNRALRIKLLVEAAEHYSLAFALLQAGSSNPSFSKAQSHDTLFNWGQCLLLHSELVSTQASSIKLLESACSKLTQAIERIDKVTAAPRLIVDVDVTKQTLAVATAKLGWKSERIDVLERAISIFRSCLESLSGNLATNFNCANALFKLARLHAAASSLNAACEAASDAAEKYLTCLDIQSDFLPSLYNWGALLLFQATVLFSNGSNSPEFDFAARMFFQIFVKVALSSSGTSTLTKIKLECLMALATQDKNQAVASMAIRTLNSLAIAKSASDSLLKDSVSFLHSIFSRPNGSSLRADSLRALDNLPAETASILNTLGSSTANVPQEVMSNSAITMRDIDVIASLSLGASSASKPVGINALYRICLKRPGRPQFLMSCMSVDSAMCSILRCDATEAEAKLSAQQLLSQHLELVSRPPICTMCPLAYYFTSGAVADDTLYSTSTTSPAMLYCLFSTTSSRGLLFNRLRSPNLSAAHLTTALRWYTAQIYSGLRNLHSKGLVLKHVIDPASLFMDLDGYAVILEIPSQQSSTPTDSDISAVPSQFIAPEVLVGRMAYTPAADWFIFGWFLYYLFSRLSMPKFVRPRAQFDGIYHSVLVDQVTRIAESKMPDPTLAPLIQGLLQRDPVKRISVAESLPAHPFFAALDWDAIANKTAQAPFKPDPTGLEEVGTDATIMSGPIQAEFRGNSFVEM